MSGSMIPIVASADDIDAAVEYGKNHANARWYIGKRLDALDAVDRIPGEWPETQPIVAARMPKLGTGKRFANLKGQLAKRGATNPGALAAWIGRRKFGGKKMAKLSAHGRTAAAVTAAADDGDSGDTAVLDRSQAGQPTPGWLRRVRAEIVEAGIDPDYLEATVPGGFSSNYDGTDAVSYAEQLIEAYAESILDEFPELLEGDPTSGEPDDADQGEETTQADPAAAATETAPAAEAPAAAGASAMTASGAGVVNFYGGVSPEALTAAVRGVVKEELKGITAAFPPKTEDDQAVAPPDAVDPDGDGDDDSVPGGPGDTDMDGGTGVPDSVPPADDTAGPVDDLDAKKAQLRARLGSRVTAAAGPFGASKRVPPVAPVGAPAAPPASTETPPTSIRRPPKARPVMAGAAMRARLAEAGAGGQGNS